ncbi:MAG: type II secretion system F family protein [Gammaproteobacteria bacterium]
MRKLLINLSQKNKYYFWKNKHNSGVVLANSKTHAKLTLLKRGMVATRIRRQFILPWKKTISAKDKKQLFSELHRLIESGFSLTDALSIISKELCGSVLSEILIQLNQRIQSGYTLSKSILKFPHIFTKYDTQILFAGEESGTLSASLASLSSYYSQYDILKRTIKKALTYPCIILLTAIIVMTILFTFVVPKFETFFQNARTSLPLLTRIILQLSHYFIQTSFIIILVISIITFLTLFTCKRYSNFQRTLEKILFKLPIIGRLLLWQQLSETFALLSTLLSSGTPLLTALQLAQECSRYSRFQLTLKTIHHDIHTGKSLRQALRKHNIFSEKTQMRLAISERTGTIDDAFRSIAAEYVYEMDYLAGQIKDCIEPFIIGLLGVIIGSIVIGMYLPIFQLGSVI